MVVRDVSALANAKPRTQRLPSAKTLQLPTFGLIELHIFPVAIPGAMIHAHPPMRMSNLHQMHLRTWASWRLNMITPTAVMNYPWFELPMAKSTTWSSTRACVKYTSLLAVPVLMLTTCEADGIRMKHCSSLARHSPRYSHEAIHLPLQSITGIPRSFMRRKLCSYHRMSATTLADRCV